MISDTFNILYEDEDIIVCYKPHGLPTQSKKSGIKDLESILKNHISENQKIRKQKSEPYLAVIHRLDQPVAGILVFAKTALAAKYLNRQIQQGSFEKYYHALLDGIPNQSEGTLINYLVKDGRTNTSRVCTADTAGAKYAKLQYKVISKRDTTKPKRDTAKLIGDGGNLKIPRPQCEVEVFLGTGRHHQIRVQLANLGCPIVGDTKYNPLAQKEAGWQVLQLCACKLTFCHPSNKKKMIFELPEDMIF